GAVRRVEDQSKTRGLHARREGESMAAVLVHEVRARQDPAKVRVRGPTEVVGPPDELLQLVLDGVIELEAVTIEDLETVVVRRVMRGGDHDPGRERPPPR